MHKKAEGMVAWYLGLKDKSALRRLRNSRPVYKYWESYKHMANGYTKPEDIVQVFQLFHKSGGAKPFEEKYGSNYHKWRDTFWKNGKETDGFLDKNDSATDKIKNLAGFLVCLKRDLEPAQLASAPPWNKATEKTVKAKLPGCSILSSSSVQILFPNIGRQGITSDGVIHKPLQL